MSKLIKSFYTVATSPYLIVNNESQFCSRKAAEDDSAQVEIKTEPDLDIEMIRLKAQEQAAEILAQAKIDAEQFLESAREEAENNKRRIYDEAYNQGYRAGMEQSELEGRKIIEEANTVLATTYEKKEEILKTIEPEVVELIISTVKKIVAMELVNPEQVLYSIKNAFTKINKQERLTIRVNSLDLETVRKARKDLINQGVAPFIELEIDSLVEVGGCIIETEYGSVDARITSQLEEMEKQIRGVSLGEC